MLFSEGIKESVDAREKSCLLPAEAGGMSVQCSFSACEEICSSKLLLVYHSNPCKVWTQKCPVPRISAFFGVGGQGSRICD